MKKMPVAFAALLLALPTLARAQKAISQAEVTDLTANIEAINEKAREITLKLDDGTVETVYAGPQVKRFNELKVGDKVTFRYYESVVYQIHKAGATTAAIADTLAKTPAIVPGAGDRPGGTVARQQMMTVTVKALDAARPSITVATDTGTTTTFHVHDKNNLKDIKVGDKVQITYTEAVVISVK